MGRLRMDKDTAMESLRSVILERFPPGPNRQRWLAWLHEFSRAEKTLQTLSGLLISEDDEPPYAH
jgi:hypothetical protein